MRLSLRNIFSIMSSVAIGVTAGQIASSGGFEWSISIEYVAATLIVIGLVSQCLSLWKIECESGDELAWQRVAMLWRVVVAFSICGIGLLRIYFEHQEHIQYEPLPGETEEQAWERTEEWDANWGPLADWPGSLVVESMWYWLLILGIQPDRYLQRDRLKSRASRAANAIAYVLCLACIFLVLSDWGIIPSLVSIGCRGIEAAQTQFFQGRIIGVQRYPEEYEREAVSLFVWSVLGLCVAFADSRWIFRTGWRAINLGFFQAIFLVCVSWFGVVQLSYLEPDLANGLYESIWVKEYVHRTTLIALLVLIGVLAISSVLAGDRKVDSRLKGWGPGHRMENEWRCTCLLLLVPVFLVFYEEMELVYPELAASNMREAAMLLLSAIGDGVERLSELLWIHWALIFVCVWALFQRSTPPRPCGVFKASTLWFFPVILTRLLSLGILGICFSLTALTVYGRL